jgi:cytochrome c oxidase subunit 4
MSRRLIRPVVTFLLLLILLALEVWMSLLPLSSSIRLLILIPAVVMVALVAFGFMEIATAPPAAHLFAVAALLWLAILLGLGSVDPLTRTDYAVQAWRAGRTSR